MKKTALAAVLMVVGSIAHGQVRPANQGVLNAVGFVKIVGERGRYTLARSDFEDPNGAGGLTVGRMFGEQLPAGTTVYLWNRSAAMYKSVAKFPRGGWGAAGIPMAWKNADCQFLLTDINQRAAELAARNAEKNGVKNLRIVTGDSFESVDGEFDVILTNPPIRAGKAVIYRMFEDAKAHLAEGGRLFLVIRKQQGAPSALKFLKELYAEAETIERDGGYWVIACKK